MAQIKLTPDEPNVIYVEDIDDSLAVEFIVASISQSTDEKFMLNLAYAGYTFFSLMRSNFSTGDATSVKGSVEFVLENGHLVYTFASYIDFLAWLNE